MIRQYHQPTGSDKIYCYYIQTKDPVVFADLEKISNLTQPNIEQFDRSKYVEWGPRLHMVTPWCSNALSVFKKCGVNCVERVERSTLIPNSKFNHTMVDPMTEQVYYQSLTSFDTGVNDRVDDKDSMYMVDNIEEENRKLKLGFDHTDLQFYENLFKKLGRKPTNIELYDLAQSNSEHSRHWFFRGRLNDHLGHDVNESLLDSVRNTQLNANDRSVVAFSDNASALRGFDKIPVSFPDLTGKYTMSHKTLHPTLTAETHNFPTGVAPFPGAATGTGGRIRDGHAIGRGGYVIAGSAGYCVGNLWNSDYSEKNIRTLVEASNGASDYGNKFGEPITLGFCRAWGQDVEYDDNSIERREWVKPIMFTGGVGLIDDDMTKKREPKIGMLVVKLGGPAYRIGVGGGSASSRGHDTKNSKEDFNAVQRGDPQMENRLNRVIRACLEMGDKNPIQSIHDQGAGGTANVTKEIVYPLGADIYLDQIPLGDKTMNPLEIWVSEYQEQDTVLVNPDDIEVLKEIGKRENLEVAVIGHVTGSGSIRLVASNKLDTAKQEYVNLPLEPVLGDEMPKKTYQLERNTKLPMKRSIDKINMIDQLILVMRDPAVGSKRFLTNKVDRSVTGLIAQQQCVGPLHTPLTDYSIIAHSYHSYTGTVTSIGEQPIKGLIDPKAMATLTMGEMLTNMIFAKITSIRDIRCSGNWMWPNSTPDEKDALYQACVTMCEIASQLGIAFDGGKDSLSMSYTDRQTGHTIKCPRSLVITGYAPTEDFRKKVTPDLKGSGNKLIYIDLSGGFQRLGGSALFSTTGSIGHSSPALEDPDLLLQVWDTIQELVHQNIILSGHDRSDGGLITTVCEMAFAGNLGVVLDFSSVPYQSLTELLFNEELGLVLEIEENNLIYVLNYFPERCAYLIGETTSENKIVIEDDGFEIRMTDLRNIWEKPSYDMDLYQTENSCVHHEYMKMQDRKTVQYRLGQKIDLSLPVITNKHKVAIIRDEGSNGDREMAMAFQMAGFEVWDLCMNDLLNNDHLTLDIFRGIAFVGGFSYADVFGAGYAWYQVINSHTRLNEEFIKFYHRKDTFSLGICNGCQLMALLGWIPKCRLEQNRSKRFESRFPHVKINKNSSIMLNGLEDSLLGVWVAHGEGYFSGINLEEINHNNILVQYTDDDGIPTEEYPMNPNGSPLGIAGLCSEDGRHLAMMPHPERCFLKWQLPYSQYSIEIDEKFSPWFLMFLNAYRWCEKTS